MFETGYDANITSAKFYGVTSNMLDKIINAGKRIYEELFGITPDLQDFSVDPREPIGQLIQSNIAFWYRQGSFGSDKGTLKIDVNTYIAEVPQGMTENQAVSILKCIIPYAACVISCDDGIEVTDYINAMVKINANKNNCGDNEKCSE
jgi:hypothetical protein